MKNVSTKKILHLDSNHPLLWEGLQKMGFQNVLDESSSFDEVLNIIDAYHGLVIRSRLPINKTFLDKAKNLEFIARIGAGLENIDVPYAQSKNILLIAANEGNCNAVAEHALGLLLNLTNRIHQGHHEIKHGLWQREANRGIEISGKTVGIIGYGHTGSAFAKKLNALGCTVLCCDILPNKSNDDTQQVSLAEIQQKADIISLHVPQTAITKHLINKAFIEETKKPFWLINTARGACVQTQDLLEGLNTKKILGAGLDVIEFEKSSFETIFESPNQTLMQLIKHPNVILTPHVAGWSQESLVKLAEVTLQKITNLYHH